MAKNDKEKEAVAQAKAPEKGKKKSAGNERLWRGNLSVQRGITGVLAIAIVVAILIAALQATGILTNGSGDNVSAGTIRISEVMADNASSLMMQSGDVEDWIELVNTGDKAVNIGKYVLFKNSDVSHAFSFPDYTLEPGGHLVVFASGTLSDKGTEWSTPFKLSSAGNDTLVLMDAQSNVIDSIALPETGRDCSYALADDGTWHITTQSTPGADNVIVEEDAEGESGSAVEITAVPGSLEITEVMSGNTLYPVGENGDCVDYIEIHNASESSVDLSQWYLSDSSTKLKKYALPAQTLASDGYAVIACDDNAPFKISSDGEMVYLTNDDGQTTSVVNVPALTSNTAYSLVGGAWTTAMPPTPGYANTTDNAATVSDTLCRDKSGVTISEITATPTEQSCDWIELYNGSDSAVDLSGYGLSDNAAKPRKWRFPSGTSIQPGQYLVICLTGSTDEGLEGYVCADFALGGSGGYTVSLSDPDGNILDAAYVPQQYAGVSYGRMNGSSGWLFIDTPTPAALNSGNSYRGRASQPTYSVAGGKFKTGDSFSVEISAPEGSRIYYTLDCSDPDENDTLYTGPITVSSTTVIRTRVYQDNCMPSYMDSVSYLYDVPGGVRVVSLVSDPDGLFSDENGILVKGPNALPDFPYGSNGKGANFWMDWEREAHVEIFYDEGGTQLSQECGIKLHGQYSRAAAAKAFKVYARSEYGSNRFNAKLFTNRDYTSYQSFLLRCSGQDYNKTFMRDSLLTSLAKDTSLMYQESDFALCYLNGEFYSVVYLRERISKFSICQFEGWEGMEDDIDIIKANKTVKQGSNETFAELLEYCKSCDPTSDEFYQKLGEVIDIRNYIEYMAIEIYSGNGDTLNVKRYRNKLTDGKWRWVLFDLDWGWFVDTNSIRRWLAPEGMGTGLYTDNTLFITCMKNPTFFEEFMIYFGQQMATTFSTRNTLSLIEARYNLIKDYLPPYLEKLGMTEDDYNKELKELVSYVKSRPTKIIGYFIDTFSFSEADQQKYFGDAIAEISAYEAENS